VPTPRPDASEAPLYTAHEWDSVDKSGAPPLQDPGSVTGEMEGEFLRLLHAREICQALGLLNARTRYRFTGVYRADPPLLRNECLFDRENPQLSLGGEVARLDQTYCGIVTATHAPFAAIDSRTDRRLAAHAARDSVVSYAGVPIRTADGRIFGSLCHFDRRPRILPRNELELLQSMSHHLAGWITERARPEA
jgi:GAF domain-containing protein